MKRRTRGTRRGETTAVQRPASRPAGAAQRPKRRGVLNGAPVPDAPRSHGYEALLTLLDRASESPPDDLPAALARLPEEPDLPPLWDVHRLIDLVPTYRKQVWALEHIFAPLVRDVPEVRKAIQDCQTLEGRSPHMPGWHFSLYYGEVESFWTADGEQYHQVIHVEPRQVASEHWIDKNDSPVSEYLVWPDDPLGLGENATATGTTSACYRHLVEVLCRHPLAGLPQGSGPEEFLAAVKKLAQELLRRTDALDHFSAGWESLDRRVWLAALLGDWPTAHAAALNLETPKLASVTEPRAVRWVKRQGDGALESMEDRTVASLLWHGFIPVIQRLHQDALAADTERALELVLELDIPGWEREAMELFHYRFRMQGMTAQLLTARYLLRRGIETNRVAEALVKFTDQPPKSPKDWDVEAAMLLAACDRKRGRQVFRAALHSPTESVCIEAAAALALSDEPWAKVLLEGAAEEVQSCLAVACCRLAIAMHEARRHGSQPSTVVRSAGAVNGKSARQVLRIRRRPVQKPVPRSGRGRGTKPMIVRAKSSDLDLSDLHYYGTIEEFFEDQVEEVRPWLVNVERSPSR